MFAISILNELNDILNCGLDWMQILLLHVFKDALEANSSFQI